MRLASLSRLTPSHRFSLTLSLILVVGATLLASVSSVLIHQTTLGQTWIETHDGVEAHIMAVFGSDIFVQPTMPAGQAHGHADYYTSAPTDTVKPVDINLFNRIVRGHLVVYNIAHARFFRKDGQIVYSYDAGEIGQTATRVIAPEVIERLTRGETVVQQISLAAAASPDRKEHRDIMALGIPVRRNGVIVGGAWVFRDISSITNTIRYAQLIIIGMSICGALVLFFGLRRVFDTSTATIRQQAVALKNANDALSMTYTTTLRALAAALDGRDTETGGHSQRVTRLALRIGHEFGLDDGQLVDLERGALLHDIGKIAVPDAILRKPGPLDDEEWAIMRQHPTSGAAMIGEIPFLTTIIPMIRYHHERWDGQGYPERLRSDTIPLGARIFAVADSFDAMTSHRPYRQPMALGQVKAEIARCAGSQFDPAIVAAFQRIPDNELRLMMESQIIEPGSDPGENPGSPREPLIFPGSSVRDTWHRVKRLTRTS